MKNSLLKLLSHVIIFLEKWKSKLVDKTNEYVAYSSLSPISNCDEDGHYTSVLSWALQNRKEQDIKNIALTGPYGSGKSSILKTFQANYKGDDLKFLNISLATFKEEKQKLDNNGNSIAGNVDLLRLIEISILQQIFYHEKDKNIPDSRFKKIKSYNWIQLSLTGIGYLLFAIAIYNYFYPNILQDIFKDFTFSKTIHNIIHYGGFLIIFSGIFFLIYKSVRIISSITINKLKIQNAEIGLGDNFNKSILNHHLDEILYFFSVRPYNVVIIEDLDRFQETEIFTKLREINLLLNSSLKTKRREIVFIYAVRDDMFTDKDRTKFFDFIMPIIPAINSSNSSEKLLEKKRLNKFNLTDSFIEDIAFVIDDMRLLHNICNEFFIYKKQLGASIKDTKFSEKLFAIITYKNIHPNDFVRLSEKKGFLFSVLNSKQKYIREKINDIENEVIELKEEIKSLESIFFKDIKDVRKLYIIKVMEKIDKFKSFMINGEEITVEQLTNSENFEYLTKDKLMCNKWFFNRSYYREETQTGNTNVKFIDIEKEVSPSKTYQKLEQEINDIKNGKINALKNKIQELEKEKVNVRSLRIAEIIQSTNDVLNFEKFNEDENYKKEKINEDLIRLLVRNGYVAEDYLDYISIFHEGSITRSDYLFSINIKNKNRQEFDYPLNKIQKLISKISLPDFATEYALNYNLVDFMFTKSIRYKNQLENIFTTLKNESEISIEFIKGFIENSENIEKFIKTLCSRWTNVWNFFSDSETYNEEQKSKLFIQIIDYAEVPSIKQIAKQSNFNQIILSNPDFLSIIQNEEKLKIIIKELELKFEELNFSNSPDELLKYVYENRYYQLNTYMIKFVIQKFGKFNQVTFDNSNYLAINQSECSVLIDYINENIDEYIENIYLKIESNVNENEETLIELLNNEELSEENKIEVIEKTKTKIKDIESVDDIDIQSLLLESNNVIAEWINLLTVFNNYEEVTESIINYVNIVKNAEELSKQKISTKVGEESIYETFWKALIQRDEIEDQNYNLILKSNPWCYKDLDLGNLSEEKVSYLIDKGVIYESVDSVHKIRNEKSNLVVKFIEVNVNEFIDNPNELELNSSEVNQILKSSVLNNNQKNKLINGCSESEITSNIDNLKLIIRILINDSNFTVTESLINKILINNHLLVKDRVILFNKKALILSNSQVIEFLNSLPSEYSKINNTGRKATIENNIQNQNLLNILKSKGLINSISETKNGLRVNHKRK